MVPSARHTHTLSGIKTFTDGLLIGLLLASEQSSPLVGGLTQLVSRRKK